MTAARERYGLVLTALAPVVPQISGSAFNIWYNTTVIQPLLVSPSVKQRFFDTVLVYNSVLSSRRFAVAQTNLLVSWIVPSSLRGISYRFCLTRKSAPPTDSPAMVCSGDLRCCLVFVHSCLYWRASASSKST